MTGRAIADIGALFPRVEIAPAEEEKASKAEKKAKPAEKESAPEGVKLVTIDEFFQTQLKTATVLQAEKIEGADKLLKLQIDFGQYPKLLFCQNRIALPGYVSALYAL